MAEAFDPYRRWLGIRPEDQPPHHYRLLGIDPFEADAEVIRDAAARQMAHVRTYQLGRHGDLSQKVLNELAAAKACLLDPAKKAAYDATLRERLKPPDLPLRKPTWMIAAAGVCAAVVALGIGLWLVAGGGRGEVDETEVAGQLAGPPQGDQRPGAAPEPAASSSPTLVEKASGLSFRGGDYVSTPIRYGGAKPITIEVIAVPRSVSPATLVGNCQLSGIALEIGGQHWCFSFHDQNGYKIARSGEPLVLDRPVHLAGVYDGRNLFLYVDGKKQATVVTTVGPHRAARFPIMIGADPKPRGTAEHFFNGTIKAVHIAFAVLHSGDFSPPATLQAHSESVLLMRFDKDTGDRALDASGKHNDGVIFGAQWVKAAGGG